MKSHDTVATRLAQILNKLNSGERLHVEILSEEFGVTIRTIQRDINERLLFLPIKKEDGTYFLEEHYLGKLNFSDMQNFAILSGIRELYPSLEDDFLKKILDDNINQVYMIKGHNYEDLSTKSEIFSELESSILKHTEVEFIYKEKSRVIKPYKLINSKGIWYLAGVEADTLKIFSLSKIVSLSSTKTTFKVETSIMQSIKNEETIWFNSKKIEVVLRVEKEVSSYFTRRNILPNQNIVKELEDGGLLVSSKVAFDEEILKLVRYWIPHVEIVSPTYLQEKLVSGLRGYLN